MTEPFDIEAAQAILQRSPFYAHLGISLDAIAVEEGKATFSIQAERHFARLPEGEQYHGGILLALADTAGAALLGMLYERPIATIDLRLDFMAPADGGELIANAVARQLGRTVNLVDIEIVNGERIVGLARCRYATPRDAARPAVKIDHNAGKSGKGSIDASE
ncbi:PaaI family thioesterase [Erythrobacter sp. AP23]|uniref:PaaI family thioesterase n=1 Tax=Erythrobacter sp. AP23 TaxID=499656 RepID=UPI00076C96E3|nr:PaaI family thioesterase [Erythrobacter sp. AP23]KWV93781.1 hypothetical protein ASS64_12865 [Erythrobacter sp. AP23]